MVTQLPDRLTAAEFEEMLTQLGGSQSLRDDLNDFRKAVNRLWSERYALIEEQPK